ncbi:hypothetical protein QUF79_14385 [Fictibacillus enclensis]|uniref:hypothetical protein n=1 Tax=Fictibacillus enclensis TaxID=1017270 RepID=UPI0025A21DC3|nr:hypothetical protein [Fictibacillus enclensis]MDM5199205.1 hypothetical protein [Fictibacillus enclensis]
MSPTKTLLTWASALFFLYAAWAGYIDQELSLSKVEGRVLQKDYTEIAVDRGMNVQTQPRYMLRLSSGENLSVSYPDFHSVEQGDHVLFIKQHGTVNLYEKKSHS